MNAKERQDHQIIAWDGKIILQGPFESQQEKDTIATKAREIAGKDTEHELWAEAIGNNEGTSGVLNADP